MLILEWLESAGAVENLLEAIDIEIDSLDKESNKEAVKTSKVHIVEEKSTWPTTWQVRCSLENDGDYQIKVKYAEKDQRKDLRRWLEKRDDRDYLCGTTTIFVKVDPQTGKAKKTGRFEWNSVAEDGTLKGKWWAFDGEFEDKLLVVDGPRPTRSIKQQERDWRLRADVLAEDRMCVVSREKMVEVLDAAHIVPVEKGGKDGIYNAIMLRTDVHRLYDRGMFRINPEDGKISMSKNLSDKYKELLGNAELPDGTRNRVRKALQKRWENLRGDSGSA